MKFKILSEKEIDALIDDIKEIDKSSLIQEEVNEKKWVYKKVRDICNDYRDIMIHLLEKERFTFQYRNKFYLVNIDKWQSLKELEKYKKIYEKKKVWKINERIKKMFWK